MGVFTFIVPKGVMGQTRGENNVGFGESQTGEWECEGAFFSAWGWNSGLRISADF